ncbi:hypothetical protein ASPCAL05101 [Aspergillus calidoustus]|uniref:Uncharacterized protein n=1 Tax=Aspergillus calidoustus TaxID=454130 RepID=A0A0U5FZY2_ASPCI|nr:hypothetical protein ASPCAL05101 [Aspergillus calidoustus]
MDVLTTTATNALEHTSGIFPVVQYVLGVGSNKSPGATWDIVDTVNNETRFIATECTLELVIRSVQPDITEGEHAETMLAERARWETPHGSRSPIVGEKRNMAQQLVNAHFSVHQLRLPGSWLVM